MIIDRIVVILVVVALLGAVMASVFSVASSVSPGGDSYTEVVTASADAGWSWTEILSMATNMGSSNAGGELVVGGMMWSIPAALVLVIVLRLVFAALKGS